MKIKTHWHWHFEDKRRTTKEKFGRVAEGFGFAK